MKASRGSVRPYRGGYRAKVYIDGVQLSSPELSSQRKAEAWIELAKEEARARGGVWKAGSAPTLAEYVELWTTRFRRKVRPSTAEDGANKLVRPLARFGDTRMDRITEQAVGRWLNDMEDEGLSASYRSNVLAYFKRVMRDAVREGVVRDHPFVEELVRQDEVVLVDPLTVEQVDKIILCAPEWFQLVLLVAAYTGMRQGEVAGLGPEHVLLEEGVVRVRRTLISPTRGAVRLGPPKRSHSSRDLPLPDVLIAPLVEHVAMGDRAACDGHRLLFALPPTRQSPHPQPIRRQRFNAVFTAAARAAGIEATPHDLRHHYASVLIHIGHTPAELQALLGHSPRSEEWKRYAHIWPGSMDRTKDRLNRFYDGARFPRADGPASA